jgi:hypothetical protein
MGNPQNVAMKIDRDQELCTSCHLHEMDPAKIPVKDGLIDNSQQATDLFQGKHAILQCVLCHDPHTGVVQLQQAGTQTTKVKCEQCHPEQARLQKNPMHVSMKLACIECHMPNIITVAQSDPAKFSGDFRTHRMTIDPTQISQVSENGNTILPEIGLNSSCRHCHGAGVGSPKTDDELLAGAANYHSAPEAPAK